MTRISGSIRLRPTRIGFLVRPDDAESISRIFRWCTCLWGGRFNPIIPVGNFPESWQNSHTYFNQPDHEVSRGYVNFFEPDLLVEAETGLAEKIGYGALSNDHFDKQIITLDDFSHDDGRGFVEPAAGLSVIDINHEEYRSKHQFVLRDSVQPLIFEESELTPIVEVLCGAFPKDEPLSYFQRLYRDVYKPKEVSASAEQLLAQYRSEASVPFLPTFHGLERTPGTRSELTFFIFDHTKTTDLIEYWNVRQFEDPVLGVPLCWIEQMSEFISGEINRNNRVIPNSPQKLKFASSVVFSRSINDETAKSILGAHLANCNEGSYHYRFAEHPRTNASRFGPRRERHAVEAGAARFDSRFDNDALQFDTLSPDFAERYGGGRNRWANVVSLSSYETDRLALSYPSNIHDRSFPRISLGRSAPIISREGWVLLQEHHELGAYLSLQSGQQALSDWLATHGVEARPSSAGRIAAQMIENLNGLRGTRLIADEETIKLLNKMAMQTPEVDKKNNGVKHTFAGRTLVSDRWHELIKRRAKKTLGKMTLERFTETGILKLGLGLPCPNCEHKNWYGLDDISYEVTCEGCLRCFKFPQGEKTARWKFRVTGPFSILNYAQGAYTVALTLNMFAHGLSGGRDCEVTFSTGLDLKHANFAREVDFAFWHTEKRMLSQRAETRFVVGEAKSFADEAVSQDDLDALKAVADVLPGTILVVSVLKEKFSENETRLLQELARWGWEPIEGRPRAPLILLTGIELFADFYVEQAWKDAGAPYPAGRNFDIFHDLELFGFATQRIHLGIDYDAEMRKNRDRAKVAQV